MRGLARSAFAIALASGCGGAQDSAASKAFADLERTDQEQGSKSDAKRDEGKRDEAKGPTFAPPFTAEQIREATKNGRAYRFRVDVPDKPPREYTITFRKVDDEGAEVQTGESAAKRLTWQALQRHAEFPKDKVTVREEKVKTPLGRLDCIVYEVAGDDGEKTTYYFARKMPGAPVYFYVERDGKRLKTTTVVDHVAGK